MRNHKPMALQLEKLEDRFMLSTVQIFAQGELGSEAFDLLVDDSPVASYTLDSTSPTEVTFETTETLTADRLAILFTNDDPTQDLTIESVVLDGIHFNAEPPDADGRFEFEVESSGTAIQVIAAGRLGEEQFNLEVNDVVVGTFEASTDDQVFTVILDEVINMRLDVVRVEFTNDLYIDEEINRDLFVDKIIVNGISYESEANWTYSTGTWVGPGILPQGFLNSEGLHVNGFFEYNASTQITVRAFGNEGTEQIEVQIDGSTVVTHNLQKNIRVYLHQHYGELTPDQIRVKFSGDVDDPVNNIDTSVFVDYILLVGRLYQTEAETVYSTGTETAEDGIVPGFGRGETLDADGFFQFGTVMHDDYFSIPEDSISVPLAIHANDNIFIPVELEFFTDALQGALELVDGVPHYTPEAEFVGTDYFFYREVGANQLVYVDLDVKSSHQQPQHLLDDRVATELTPSGKSLLVEKLVQLPRNETGRQPRMNSMATVGDRVFIVTDGSAHGEGRIYELTTAESGETSFELFLDVGAAVFANSGLNIDNSSPLGGLRSVAFHPEFATNGKFYTTLTGQRPADPMGFVYLSEPAEPVDAESVLVEWTLDFVTEQVDTTSYREVFRVGMQNSEHAIRQAVFNPFAQVGDEDYGLLYIGHGDGSVQSAIAGGGMANDALGKILRIDPLQNGTETYTVPASNPFVDDPEMIDEVYSQGFRNPHNLTFALDSSGVARLIVTEIGRDNIEEVNVVVKGENYGWADREGPFVHEAFSNAVNELSNLPADEVLNGYTFPNVIFGHDGEIGTNFVGQAIAGGHVIQNGSSELDNQFVFVEFASDGRAYHVDFSEMLEQVTKLDAGDPTSDSPDDLTWSTPQELTILFDHDSDDSTTPLIRDSLKDVLDDEPDFSAILSNGNTRADLRLGQGPNGELYILNKRNGWVYVATNTTSF